MDNSNEATSDMKQFDPSIALQIPEREPTENSLHLHQIDAEITRLTKQLEYLQRVRWQYANLIHAEGKIAK